MMTNFYSFVSGLSFFPFSFTAIFLQKSEAWVAMTKSKNTSFSMSSWLPFFHTFVTILLGPYIIHRDSIFGLKASKEVLKP